MGEAKPLIPPSKDVESRILEEGKLEGYVQDLRTFRVLDQVLYQTNLLVSTTIGTNRNYLVAYTNVTPRQAHADLNVSYYNEYGAQICHVEARQKVQGGAGGIWNLGWPQELTELSEPRFVLFQYRLQESLLDKGRNYWSLWRQEKKGIDTQEDKKNEDNKKEETL